MSGSNIAGSWAEIARDVPDRTAMIAGDRRVTWAAFAERSRHLAWHIRHTVSPTPGDRVAIALNNRTEYLEAFFAALSLRCVPVNVSPQYPTDEISHVLDDSDAKLVVHAPDLAKSVRSAARRIPKRWRPQMLEVGEPYEQALVDAAVAVMPTDLPVAIPDANDVIFQYERSSAGALAGAMWRSGDLCRGLAGRCSGVVLVLAPLAHSSGLFPAISTLEARGTVVLIDAARVDVNDVWRAVEQANVETIVVGSESVRRRLDAARASDLTWDLSTLHTITAWGGAAAGVSVSVGERLAVLNEETMQPVLPGSGEVGVVAVTGLMPVGFWKDTARTTATFRVVDGTRYEIRGDHATVDADGTVRVIGRPIGTGLGAAGGSGAESFPVEDVERRLGKHASVQDCAVVGVPDRSGELVVALVVVTDNHYLDEPELVAWSRTKFQHHEAPSRFLFVDTLERTESGALDRIRLRAVAAEILDR